MKTTFNVNKTTRAAIKFAALSVNRKSNVPILENIHCSANGSLEMTGTDLDVWTVSRCPCNSEIDGKVTLPCPALKDVAGVKIDGEIFFSSDEKNIVTISQSGNERRIYGLAADEFPAMPVLGKTRNVVLNGGKLIAALKAVSLAMSTDESRYVLNGVCFEVGAEIVRLIATDGRRLQMAEISRLGIDAEIEKTKGFIGKKNGKLAMAAGAKLIRLQTCLPFIIPAKAIELIQKFPLGKNPLGTEISMEFGETYARFTFGDFTLITKQIEENYPNYKQVIPIDFKERVTVSAKEFQNALEIAKKGTSEKARAVRLDIENNLLVASSNSPEVGATVAKMPVNYKGKPFCISFDPAYLIDACKSVSFIGADMVCDFTDELTPVKISSPDGVLQIVIMPMRMESGKPCVEKPVVSAPVSFSAEYAEIKGEKTVTIGKGIVCDADSQSRQIGQPAKIVTPQVAPLAGCSPLGIKPAVVSDPVETVASVPSYGEIDILTVPVNKPLIARRNQAKRILETLAVKYAGDASMTDRELSLLEDVLPAYIGKLELQIMAMDKAKFGEIAAPVISEIVSENAVASVETASADESADYTSMAMRECSIVAHPTKPAWFMVIEAGDTRGTAGETLRAAGNREHCEKWLAKIQTDQASRKAVASVEPSQPESVDLKTVLAAPTIDASKHYLFHTKPGDIAPTVNGGNIFIVGHFAKRKDARAVLQKFHDAGAHQAKIEPWLKGEKSKSMWAVLLPNVSQSLANQIAEKLALPVAEKPQGYAAPLPAGNFGEMCRSIARGVKLASVAPVRGELPEPAKPFEVANLEEKFAAGWQKSIAAGSVRPVAPALPDIRVTVAGGIVTRYEVLSVAGGTWTRGTIMQGAKLESLRACFDDLTFEVIEPVKVETAFADEAQPEPVTIKQDLSSDVIPIIRTDEAGQVINGNFREASGPVVLPPIPGRALSAMIEAGKQLAALMTAQPVPPFIGAEI